MRKKFIYTLWVLLLLGVGSVFFLFFAITKGWIGYMPPVEELENPNYKFASQVISADGELMGTWSYQKNNRVYVSYQQLPKNLVDALIATEDVRFREHSGIDFRAFMRALIKRGIMGDKNAGGGSTITQQLAKQLYSEVAGSTLERLFQKPIEWVIAVNLEKYYSKEEILSMYLNYFDFNYNAIGIKTASNTYFGKDPWELDTEESAMLVGMCKNPSLYNPRRFKENALNRRNTVLSQMEKAGYLDAAECDSLQAMPIALKFRRADHKEGIATYLRMYLRDRMMAKKPLRSHYAEWQNQQFYEDSLAWETDPIFGWCNKNFKKDGRPYNIYTDGLKVYTTINSRMQRYAEEAVDEHVKKYLQPAFFKEKKGRKTAPFTNKLTTKEVETILVRAMRQSERYRLMRNAGHTAEEIRKAFDEPHEMSVFTYDRGEVDTIMSSMDSIRYYKHFLRCGFMSMEPSTGHVKAYVGGPDFTHFQYDMAMVGRRQVGSTIKPYLYTLAMENGFTPCDETRNVEQTIITEEGKPWSPRNTSRNRYGEMVTLKWGLSQSNNWISAYLMSKLNPYAFKSLIHQFGIRNQDVQPVPSLCLGPCDISVGEMVGAYTAFPNNGIRTEPLFVTRIEDSEGNIVATFTPKTYEVISRESSYKMIDMMRAVIDEGTGRRLRFRYGLKAEIAGKTGTTNENADGWFMGYTPSLVSGCWVGGDDRDIHFTSMSDGQGASMALPIWALYMQKVYADETLGYSQDEKFNIPEDFDPCAQQTIVTNMADEQQLDESFSF